MNKPAADINQYPFQRMLLAMLAVEWLIFVCSGVSFTSLANDPFFSIGVDPLYWIFYAAGIPQFIAGHQWAGIAADAGITLLLAVLLYKPSGNKPAMALLFLLLLFYITLTGYHTHRNFQSGFVFVLFPFIFKTLQSRRMAYEAARYFLLFFYASSAMLKLFSPSLFSNDHFSEVLTQQFVPYFLESNHSWRTALNLYLTQHNNLAHGLFIAAFLIELLPLAGFFTKKYDYILGALLLCFHFVNWALMDIAPFGQVAFICMLFMHKAFPPKK